MKFALFLFITGFGLASLAENIHIEINIDAEGGLFWVDKVNDPDAYDRLPPETIQEFHTKATQKAELYCLQALGISAEIKKIKDWTSIYPMTFRSLSISHHSTIKCIRELDLSSHDRTIGKYIEHAYFVLSNVSDRPSLEDNHQLIKNTCNILKQIGAPALSLLWTMHRKQKSEDGNDKFFKLIGEIIKDNTKSALHELISIIFDADGLLMEQKSQLLRLGKWPLPVFYKAIEDALDKAIANYLNDDHIFCFESTGNIGAIIILLNGLNFWLHDRTNEGSIANKVERHVRNIFHEKLIRLQNKAPNICLIKDFMTIAHQFEPLVLVFQTTR